MKLFVKMLMLVLVLAVAGLFFVKGPNGQPLMQVDRIMPDWHGMGAGIKSKWRQATGKVTRAVGGDDGGSADGKTRVYRWQDADGTWHFSDEPPPDGNAEALLIDPNVNLVPGNAAPAPAPLAPPAASSVTPAPTVDAPARTPARVKQLIDDAHNVQGLLDERMKKIDETPQ